jgi:hypothetical protein
VQTRGVVKRWPARAIQVLFALAALSPVALSLLVGDAGAGGAPATSASVVAPAPRSTTVVLRPLAPGPPAPTVTLGRALPDPPPLVEKNQWVYDLRYSGGELYLLGIHRLELPSPQATPRAMGRFCLELYEGSTLLERARFDFPMLGDGANLPSQAGGGSSGGGSLPDAGAKSPRGGRPPPFAKTSSRIGVMFPAAGRGTRIEIVDRALDRRWPLPWPPTEMTSLAADPTTDAGQVD